MVLSLCLVLAPLPAFAREIAAHLVIRQPQKIAGTPDSFGAENLFPRGDADCSISISAADIVAAIRGRDQAGDCRNDCDRNGAAGESDDIGCTVGCQFGDCRVPPHAPQIDDIQPYSRAEAVPFSVIRITGTNFGSGDHPTRVTIGGADAGVPFVEAEDSMLVMVPPVPPGEADVVVSYGDLAGRRFPISVSDMGSMNTTATLNTTATFEQLNQRMFEALMEMAELELGPEFGETAEIVLDQVTGAAESTQAFVEEFLSADFSSGLRQAFDTAAAESGLIIELENFTAEVHAIGSLGRPVDLVLVRGPAMQLAGAAHMMAELMRQVVSSFAPPPPPPLLGPAAVVFAQAAVLTLVVEAMYALLIRTPILPLALEYFDVNGAPSDVPIAGGIIRIPLRLIDLVPAQLFARIIWNGPPLQAEPIRTSASPPFIEIRLPERIGLCDDMQLQLVARPAELPSRPRSLDLYPQLLDVITSNVRLGRTVELEVTGALGCRSGVLWPFGLEGEDPFFTGNSGLYPIPLDPPPPAPSLGRTTVPNLPQGPGSVFVELRDRGLRSNALPITFDSEVTAMTITCPGSPIELGELIGCTATPTPENRMFPIGSEISFTSSDPGVAAPEFVIGPAVQSMETFGVGTAEISAILRSRGLILAVSSKNAAIEVVDTRGPAIELTPEDGQTLEVDPGDRIHLTATASDLSGVTDIQLVASPSPVESIQTSGSCSSGIQCIKQVEVVLRDEGLTTLDVTIQARAIDGIGNESVSPPLSFSIRDDSAPAITVSASQADQVTPGTTIVFTVEATDDIHVDRLELAIDGDAATATETSFSCPTGSAAMPCSTTFQVTVADAGFSSRDFVVRFTAVDLNENRSNPEERQFRVVTTDIGGNVFDGTSGASLTGATVELLAADGSLVDSTLTSDGRFLFAGLSPGIYAVRASASGFTSRTEEVNLASGSGVELSLPLRPRTGDFIFAFAEVHELYIESCFIDKNGDSEVEERRDRRGGVFAEGDPIDEIALDNLLRFARTQLSQQGAGWTSTPGRGCIVIYSNVLGVTVSQIGGLSREEAQALQRAIMPPESEFVSVPGCEILGVCVE